MRRTRRMLMKTTPLAAALVLACPFAASAAAPSAPPPEPSASTPSEGTTKANGVVTIIGSRPTSLPTVIPTTIQDRKSVV